MGRDIFSIRSLIFMTALVALPLVSCSGSEDTSAVDSELDPSVDDGRTLDGVSASKTTLDFSADSFGAAYRKSTALLNNGDTPIVLSASVSGSDQFMLELSDGTIGGTLSNLTLPADSTLTLNVIYTRRAVGTHNALLKIKNSAGESLDIQLRGTTTGTSDEAFTLVPASLSCGDSNQPVDFGQVTEGKAVSVGIKICNRNDTSPLVINSLSSTTETSATLWELLNLLPMKTAHADACTTPNGTAASVSQMSVAISSSELAKGLTFKAADGSALSFPLTVPAGSYVKVNATLTADLTGKVDEGKVGKSFVFELPMIAKSGSKKTATAIRGTILPKGPQLTVDGAVPSQKPALTFSTAKIPSDATIEKYPTRPFTITNTGSAALSLSATLLNTSSTGTFEFETCPTFPLTIAAGASTTLPIRYNPKTLGTTRGKLTVTSNAVNGGTTVFDLIADASSVKLVDWTYRKSSILDDTHEHNLGQLQVGNTTFKTFTITNQSEIADNTLTTTFSLASFAASGATFAYLTETGQSVPFKLGEAVSIRVNPGQSKTFTLAITLPNTTNLLDQALTGTIALTNRLKNGAVDTQSTLAITTLGADEVVEPGSPIENATDVPAVITQFSMLINSPQAGKQVVASVKGYRSDALSFGDLNLSKQYAKFNPVSSTTATEIKDVLGIQSTKFMMYCFDMLSDAAIAAGDTSHYSEDNFDDNFDFVFDGTPYCIDSSSFSTGGTPCQNGGKKLSKTEYEAIYDELSDCLDPQIAQTYFDQKRWVPEISTFFADLTPTEGSYIHHDDTGTSELTMRDVTVGLKLGPNAETCKKGLCKMAPDLSFLDTSFSATFTTNLFTSTADTSDNIVSDSLQSLFTDESFLLADAWVGRDDFDARALQPYMHKVGDHYYFGGEEVNWSPGDDAPEGALGCFKMVSFVYTEASPTENTFWILEDSPAFIFLTACFMDDKT